MREYTRNASEWCVWCYVYINCGPKWCSLMATHTCTIWIVSVNMASSSSKLYPSHSQSSTYTQMMAQSGLLCIENFISSATHLLTRSLLLWYFSLSVASNKCSKEKVHVHVHVTMALKSTRHSWTCMAGNTPQRLASETAKEWEIRLCWQRKGERNHWASESEELNSLGSTD